MIVNAFISSKLDHCNSLLHGLPKYLLARLQAVQNAAARVVTLTPKHVHITPILINLHWLPVEFRSNISNMRCSVSSPDETPRRELKIGRAAEYF